MNFWKPSARRGFNAPQFSPFLFKLRAPHNAICGFALFAQFSRLPAWLAWETFGRGNGCPSFESMRDRIERIRRRIGYQVGPESEFIGCVLLVAPVLFPPAAWIPQPEDWPVRTQTDKRYDLSAGVGRQLWERCLAVARDLRVDPVGSPSLRVVEVGPRYGEPVLVKPRLGQGTFRIGVTDAYARACAVTGEHSLPVLDAAHIQPYGEGGPHRISNGVLLRSDLHRLFDKGYVTITTDLRLQVSDRLRKEYRNGHTYYPFHDRELHVPKSAADRPDPAFLRWHNEHVFAA